ncbi:uncharacterized protein LOC110446017 [Mizuhopecten yessoensis]|uniref:uncharacterized protein LOC110446017 n=1 Tax=Mizuhopecten yessoensis TaxID=6573 RepID=UPI000B45B40A|nr:uncharacterized protein LOC110446017 [Mizuhopecten yessoensis]
MEEQSKSHLSTVAMAIFVRLLLIFHTVLATWRVTLAWNNPQFWLMCLGVVLVALEGYITIRVNKGIEWKWLCPCFAIYLVITLPSIWLLEISQMNKYMESQTGAATTANATLAPTTVQTVTSDVTRTMTTALAANGSNVSATMATTASNISDILNDIIATTTSNISDIVNVSMATTTSNISDIVNVTMATTASVISGTVNVTMATATSNISDILNVTMATTASDISDIVNVTMATTTSNISDILNVTMATTASNISDIVNATIETTIINAIEMLTNNTTDLMTSTVPMTTTTSAGIIANIEILLDSFNADTWVVVVEESLVYLIVNGRWLLPRGRVTREELSDLLFDYLAMASDIMELFALFDEDSIRGNPMITYAILAIWSVSFIQFIPVVMNRRAVNSFRKHTQDEKDKSNCCVCAGCGNSFPDIFVTIAGLFLQDGPFLALRLFIIFYLQLLTYSLVFFVLKNTIVVLLLTYRLGILCFNLPCCSRRDATKECMEELDMDDPFDFGSSEDILKKNDLYTSDQGIINSDYHDQSVFGESYYRDHNKAKNDKPQNGHRRGVSIGEASVSGNPVNGLGVRNGNLPVNIRSLSNSGYPVHGREFSRSDPRPNDHSSSNSRLPVKTHQYKRPDSTASFNAPVRDASPSDRVSIGNGRSTPTNSLISKRPNFVNTDHVVGYQENIVRARSIDFSSPDVGSLVENVVYFENNDISEKRIEPESKRLRTVIRIGYDDAALRGVKL